MFQAKSYGAKWWLDVIDFARPELIDEEDERQWGQGASLVGLMLNL